MDPQASPPKRMTRARAAKVGEGSTAIKTTRIVTAAAKAKATRSTAPASTKRKTRADEVEDGDDQEDELAQPEPAQKTRTRGRPKKAAEPEPEPEAAPATRTRGRPKRAVEQPKEEAQAAKPATRTTRTKKTTQPEPEAPAEPVKKPATRTRGAATAPTKSTAAKSATAKKSVKFEEPEKENIEPAPTKTTRGKAAATAAEPATTGLRAKPVRRAAASTTARSSSRAAAAATKSSGQESKYDKPTPLSPRKITQLAMHNRANNHLTGNHDTVPESEDELAADEKTPIKPRDKALSGARVRGGIKLQVPRSAAKTQASDENEAENEDVLPMPSITLGSPCRRPPPSPWKDSLKTPAKRVDGVPGLAQSAVRPPTRLFDSETGQSQQPQSAFKTSLLQSPARRPHSAMKGLDLRPAGSLQLGAPSPFRSSLFSPPKRGLATPGKGSFMGFSSPRKQQQEDETTVFGRTPAPKPTLLATPLAAAGDAAHDEEQRHSGEVEIPDDVQEEESEPNRLLFPGRMSAVLPRHADPALDQGSEAEEEQHEEHVQEHQEEERDSADDHPEAGQNSDDAMHLDEPEHVTEDVMPHSERKATTSSPAPPLRHQQQQQGAFGLREKDLDPHYHDQDTESEGEDELAATPSRHTIGLPATPCPPTSRSTNMSVRPANFGERSTVKRARTDDNKFGFTPLAGKLGAWNAGSSPVKSSPLKMGMGRPESPDVLSLDHELTARRQTPAASASPMRNNFFEEAMSGQTDGGADEVEIALDEQVDENHDVDEYHTEEEHVEDAHVEEQHISSEAMQTEEDGVLTPEFDDIPVTQEDISLAAEAHEMSLMEPSQVEDLLHDDALSEASQEYGDENAIPIDPTLMVPPVTPQRNVTGLREFHTVSKVPLKPADDSTPRPKPKRRGHSISRLPVQRPNQGLQRNATVISYSPTKQSTHLETPETEAERRESAPPTAPTTPAKSEWSIAGTPARTPRRDLNPALLGGAVVFVDVHTSEGADASGIFVELLAQMGARCVKTWAWNPSSSPPQAGAAQQAKVGITHVVYKDGGKRTLEKVRESNGVVQCVGVSWVLDCERENKWLDEAPYYIDTSLVPRGGARRRKSMEPKALANMDGQVVVKATPSSSKSSSARECQSLPATPIAPSSSRRRDSSLWMRTPPEQQLHHSPEEEEESEWDLEGNNSFLTPVPKTPAPEQVARYAAAVGLEATPTGYVSESDGEDEGKAEEMMTRTCPPKSGSSIYRELGDGVLKREKDEGVLMRLMAARRKSLQFAPKVGSPLARAWK